MTAIFDLERLAAFSINGGGGNPAAVAICDLLPDEGRMQAIAAEVGYSETVFAAPVSEGWRVRYFAPEIEIPFCGHATIALGAELAARHGNGAFQLLLNDRKITVEGRADQSGMFAVLNSPPTRSTMAQPALLERALALFGNERDDLDSRLPSALIEAGARHLALAFAYRQQLAAMRYDFDEGRSFMLEHGLATISLMHAETEILFHARNPFAAGGVYEDPATGAAAAAWAGYLRDLRWPHGGAIEIVQGEDMGVPCHLRAEITPVAGASIRVSGAVRRIE